MEASVYKPWLDEVLLVPTRNSRRSRDPYETKVNTFAEAFASGNQSEITNAAGFIGESVFRRILQEFSSEDLLITLTTEAVDKAGCDVSIREEGKTIGGFNVTLSPTREKGKIAQQGGVLSLTPLPMRRKGAEQIYFPTVIVRPQLHMRELIDELKAGNLPDFDAYIAMLVNNRETLESLDTDLERAQNALQGYPSFSHYIGRVRSGIAHRLQQLPLA